MMTRIRVILPPEWSMIGSLLLYAICEGPYLYLEWRLGQPLDAPRPGLYLLRMIAFNYGVWRLQSFHPALRPDYRAWLERTPWTRAKPLPAGPASLVWEDALPLGALAILAALQGPMATMALLGIFLIGYLLALAGACRVTGTGGFSYLIAFGIGLAVRLWPDPRAFLGAAVGTYVVGWIGLQVSLAKFPWPAFEWLDANARLAKLKEDSCGWPFDQLKPGIAPEGKFRRVDGFLLGLLAGWSLYAFESLIWIPADRPFWVHLIFANSIFFLAAFRTGIYRAGLAPPISLWGRIRTFRWIVPGYDQVFVAPLCTLLVGVLAFDRFRPPGLDDLVFLPAALAVAVAVTLTSGPSLTRWRLTGQHRFSSGAMKVNAEYVKVG